MSVKRLFAARQYSTFGDAALMVLRVVVGLAFMKHGWGKIQHPFDWMGPGAFAPAPFQALAAVSEFGGGLCWMAGLFTPLACLGIACVMVVATWMHAVMRGDPFVTLEMGKLSYEPAAVYLCVAILLLALGPGSFSGDRVVFGRK